MSDILCRQDGAVRLLTINRPARRNALTRPAAEGLRAELAAAIADEQTGAVVLTGAGGHFSAGGDGAEILAAAEGDPDAPARLMRVFHQLVETVWTAPLPVVAAVSGVAYGGGFNLALACDLVVCSADTRFCQVFVRRGVVPDLGGAYLLPRLVGLQRAKQLMLLAPEIGAAHALQLGLVNAVLPEPDAALQHALSLAGQLAAGHRPAIAQAKTLLNASTGGSLSDSLELEAGIQAALLRSEPVRRSFADFLAGRGRLMTRAAAQVRTRDPARKDRILAAAADLVASSGYHAVSMADIGAAAGITGSGIYRHFASKSALLVALFDQAIDGLLRDERQIVQDVRDLRRALLLLVQGQVDFVIADRELAIVYHNEINNLPAADRRRLRRKQRLYLEEWVHLVDELHDGLTDSDARTLVHAAIGAIQSALFHASGLPGERLRELLTSSAVAILGCS